MMSGASASVPASLAWPKTHSAMTLKSGQPLPPVGMGTWLTFDVALAGPQMVSRAKVLENFFAAGGGMIDSSPMYGRSEAVIGKLTTEAQQPGMFSATKIWTPLAGNGLRQLSASHDLWGEEALDLVCVHNLLQWEGHLKTLRAAKEAGRVRYIGLTTSHGRRHEKLEQLIVREDMDAVQLTYNILNREAEKRLLPAAMDKGLSVIVNRPFMGGALFDRVKGRDLPGWAADIDCQSWAEVFLKFLISHPAVSCAIPATRNPDHMQENIRAGTGPMPDKALRARMVRDFEVL